MYGQPMNGLQNGMVYHISARHVPGKVLGCGGGLTTNGTEIVLWDLVEQTPNQQWRAEERGNGCWSFTPLHAPGQRLDSTPNVAQKCQLWDSVDPNNGNQLFRLEPMDAGHFLVIRVRDNAAWDIAGAQTHNGANLQTWSDHTRAPNQQFHFRPVGGACSPNMQQPMGMQQQMGMGMGMQQQAPLCNRGHHLQQHQQMGSWRCDKCGSGGPQSMRCFQCDYDLCPRCYGHPMPMQQQGPPPCNRGHPLQFHQQMGSWRCDKCGNGGPHSMRCFQCDFDLCPRCYGHPIPQQMQQPNMMMQQQPMMGQQNMMMQQGPPPCNRGHPLQFHQQMGSWRCDKCGNGGPHSMRCFQCDYDLCPRCYGHPIPQQMHQPNMMMQQQPMMGQQMMQQQPMMGGCMGDCRETKCKNFMKSGMCVGGHWVSCSNIKCADFMKHVPPGHMCRF